MVNGIDRAFYQIGTQFKFLWTEQQSKCFQLWQHHLSIMGTYFSQNFLDFVNGKSYRWTITVFQNAFDILEKDNIADIF